MLYLAQLISIAAVLVLLLALVIVGGYSVTAVAAQPAYLTVLGAQALLARRVPDPWVFRVPPAGWKAFVCQVIGTVVTWALAEVGYASFATLRAIVAAYWRGGATLPDVATIFIRVPLDIDWKTMPPAT